MNKKIAIILLIVVIAVMFTACNKQIIDLNFKYTRAYVNIGGTWTDVKIKTWTDYEDGEQIQIKLEDDTMLLLHASNCILYTGDLPSVESRATPSASFEQQVKASACSELDKTTSTATLTHVKTEYVAWLNCNVYTYIISFDDGSVYLAGARENEDGFYCDVECEL